MKQTECEKCNRLIRANNFKRHTAVCDGTYFTGPHNPSKRKTRSAEELQEVKRVSAKRAREALHAKYNGVSAVKGRRVLENEDVFTLGRSMSVIVRDRYFELVEEPVCAECDQTTMWNGKPLVLQLDHINGDRWDNRLENLRLMCPNCHSQTETFNKRKDENGNARTVVSDEDLMLALIAKPNIRQALLSVGMRDSMSNYNRARRLLNK